jgi:hypothetical protein
MTIRVKITNSEGEGGKSLYITHYDPTSTIVDSSERIDTVLPGNSIELTVWEKNYLTLSEKKLI